MAEPLSIALLGAGFGLWRARRHKKKRREAEREAARAVSINSQQRYIPPPVSIPAPAPIMPVFVFPYPVEFQPHSKHTGGDHHQHPPAAQFHPGPGGSGTAPVSTGDPVRDNVRSKLDTMAKARMPRFADLGDGKRAVPVPKPPALQPKFKRIDDIYGDAKEKPLRRPPPPPPAASSQAKKGGF
ncbi:hypothetical protein BDW62DRAFT_206039 [Aspergillus aurantiobrunneus]